MPTHPIEGPDYAAGSGALSGDRVFKDTDPATEFIAVDANAIWHGLRTLVKQEQISGDLTASSGATDNTEGFIRLSKGIRRAARRGLAASQANVVIDGPGYTFTLTPDVFVYNITEDGGGPYPGATVYPDATNDADNTRRIILVINGSTTSKAVGDSASGQVATLWPGESCFFYGKTVSGSTLWVPSMQLDESGFGGPPSYNARFYYDATYKSSSLAVSYVPHGPGKNLLTINVPKASFTLAPSGVASNAIILCPAGGIADLPDYLIAINGDTVSDLTPGYSLLGEINGTQVTFLAIFESNRLSVKKLNGNFANSDVVTVYPFSLTYIRLAL